MTPEEIFQLIQSLIWLLAGVGVFIVGMNFMGDALEKSAGIGMKKMLEKISNNRFSGVGIGAGVTAIIQSSSATSVMVIGLVNAGVMTLMQATPIIMGANIGTTITGVLVALKNDIFNMIMYLLAFAGVMMGFFKKEKIKIIGTLFCGLGLIFIGLNVMSSEQAFGNSLVEEMFTNIFEAIDFPLLLILVGVLFTALIQSSSASTGVVITMVGAGVLPLDLALFIVLGANIGTCVTALLASIGANANSKRVALIHFTFNLIGTVVFTILIWIFREPVVNFLMSLFPGDDVMSLQMRVSVFHVIFNVTTTCLLLPFVKHLVKYSCMVIKDKPIVEEKVSFMYIDERLLSTPPIAVGNIRKEIVRMGEYAKQNVNESMQMLLNTSIDNSSSIAEREKTLNALNKNITAYLTKLLSKDLSDEDDKKVGSYYKVVSDIERVGDYAENVMEYSARLKASALELSKDAAEELSVFVQKINDLYDIAFTAFDDRNTSILEKVEEIEEDIDNYCEMLEGRHIDRVKQGSCTAQAGSIFLQTISNLERVADHINNVAKSIKTYKTVK